MHTPTTPTTPSTSAGRPAGWEADPSLPGRLRYWDGRAWSDHVALDGETYQEPYLGPDHVRWQYGVINLGAFNAMDRMQAVLGAAGSMGWQLVGIYDKQSNWSAYLEKGFMLLRKPVQPGVRLADDQWCITISMTLGTSAPR
jgi:hypothetical protein